MRSLSPVIRLKLPGLAGQLPGQLGRNEAAKAATARNPGTLSRHDPLQDNSIISNVLLCGASHYICQGASVQRKKQGQPKARVAAPKQRMPRLSKVCSLYGYGRIPRNRDVMAPKCVSESVPNPDPLGLIMHALLRVLSGLFLPPTISCRCFSAQRQSTKKTITSSPCRSCRFSPTSLSTQILVTMLPPAFPPIRASMRSASSSTSASSSAYTMASRSVRVAVTQAEPAWVDLPAAVSKTCDLINEAALNGAQLVAFPEVWIPGYPCWIWYAAEPT